MICPYILAPDCPENVIDTVLDDAITKQGIVLNKESLDTRRLVGYAIFRGYMNGWAECKGHYKKGDNKQSTPCKSEHDMVSVSEYRCRNCGWVSSSCEI
jgi:hypothetical protein